MDAHTHTHDGIHHARNQILKQLGRLYKSISPTVTFPPFPSLLFPSFLPFLQPPFRFSITPSKFLPCLCPSSLFSLPFKFLSSSLPYTATLNSFFLSHAFLILTQCSFILAFLSHALPHPPHPPHPCPLHHTTSTSSLQHQ